MRGGSRDESDGWDRLEAGAILYSLDVVEFGEVAGLVDLSHVSKWSRGNGRAAIGRNNARGEGAKLAPSLLVIHHPFIHHPGDSSGIYFPCISLVVGLQ